MDMGESPNINLNLPTTEQKICKLFRRSPTPSPAPSPIQKHKQISAKSTQNATELTRVSGSATGNPRNKCALKPGHSLMDWIRLGNSGSDLTGTHGVIKSVTHVELSKHCKMNDGWLAIRGKVYNVTHYMDFHPGGTDELMKGVGKDATKMFDDVHAWVNYEQLLAKCYVGPLINTATISLNNDTSSKLACKSTNGVFKTPILPFLHTAITKQSKTNDVPQMETSEIIPRFDWIQKTPNLTIIFYTKSMCNPGFSVEYINDIEITVRILIERTLHIRNFKFADRVQWPCKTKVSNETGKIELEFIKTIPALWTNFGQLDRRKTSELLQLIFEYDVITSTETTHDSYVVILKPKRRILQHFPIGCNISITAKIQGTNVTRSYTPVPITHVPNPCSVYCVPLLVKCYPSGIFSRHITRLNPLANTLYISHPKGNFTLYQLRNHTRIALLAAGSGVTPMLSILDYLIERTSNRLEAITFLYFNKTEKDIWCLEQLELLAKKDNRITLSHILSEPLETWTNEKGRVSSELVSKLVDRASTSYSTFCCVCGPPAFNELCTKLLQDVGIQSNNLHVFRG